MTMPKAYSYLRFSTPEQAKGDSFRRQTELSQRYAKRHKLDLDETLTFRDLGKSAYRGANAKRGELGDFIEAVKSGKIAKGSYLLVENLDRLSRDKVNRAYQQFTDILDLGVNIVTLTDEKLYTADSINDNFTDLMMSLMIMHRAHEESALKARRLGAAWKEKKKEAAHPEGEKITSRGPAWLSLDRENNKWVVNEQRRQVIERVFDMTIAGHGKTSIMRTFNAEQIPTFGKSNGWHPSYIQKLLENEAVLGVYQPMKNVAKDGQKGRVEDGEPIPGYYPEIVTQATFERARLSRAARRIPRGRKGNGFSNLFTGIMLCGSCGAPIHFENKGKGRRGGSYLVCSNARRAVANCKAVRWKYGPIEALLVLCLDELNYDELFPDIASNARDTIMRLENMKLEKDAELAKLTAGLENLANALMALSDQPTLMKKLVSTQTDADSLSAELDALNAQLESERESARNAQQDLRQVRDGLHRLNKAHTSGGPQLFDIRSRLHQLLKRTVKDIRLIPASAPVFDPKRAENMHGAIAIQFKSSKIGRALYVQKDQKACRSVPVRGGKEDWKGATRLAVPVPEGSA